MVEEVQRVVSKFLCEEDGEDWIREGRRKKKETTHGIVDLREFISLVDNWAELGGCKYSIGRNPMIRMQQEMVKESVWQVAVPKRLRQKSGKDGTEMQKEANMGRCTLLHGSAWSTERKYMRKYRGPFDIFFRS